MPASGKRPEGYLFVLPWSYGAIGGVNEVVRNLAACFGSHPGYRPLLAIANGGPEEAEDQPEAPYLQVRPMVLRDPWTPQESAIPLLAFVKGLPGTFKALRAFVREHNVTVINPHFPGLFCLNLVLFRRSGLFAGKLVLTFQGSDARHVLNSRGVARRIWKWMLPRVDAITACSRELARHLTDVAPGCAAKISIVPNGIDPALFEHQPDACLLPAALQDRRFILHVGRFSRIKGQDVLLDAFDQAAGSLDGVHLVLVGASGPESGSTRERIERSPLRERMHMFENVSREQMASFFRAASLYVLSSRQEGFPLVLLEAAIFRLPIVASAIAAVPDLLTEGETGRLVPPESPQRLAAAIEQAFNAEEASRRMADTFHRQVLEQYRWDTIVETYLGYGTGS